MTFIGHLCDNLKTFPRRLPQDLLKTSPRLFLEKASDHLETIHGLSRYVLNYIYTATPSLTKCINLNKLHTLKHGNNAEIVKKLAFNKMPD